MEKLIMESKTFAYTKNEKKWLDERKEKGEEVPFSWHEKHIRTIRWKYPEIVFQNIKSKDELMEFLYDEGIRPDVEIIKIPEILKNIIDKNLVQDYWHYFGRNKFNELFDTLTEAEKEMYKKNNEWLDEAELNELEVATGSSNQTREEIILDIKKSAKVIS